MPKGVYERTAEHRRKISEAAQKRKKSPNPGFSNRSHSEEARKKISDGLKGRTVSDETREKLSKASSGRPVSEEARQKISNALTGRSSPREVCDKISAANRGKKNGEQALGFRFSSGYKILSGQYDHPLASPSGSLAEHRKVLYDSIGPGAHECHWCQDILTWGGNDGIQTDHLNGITDDNRRSNLVPSCSSCNRARAHAGNPPDWNPRVRDL